MGERLVKNSAAQTGLLCERVNAALGRDDIAKGFQQRLYIPIIRDSSEIGCGFGSQIRQSPRTDTPESVPAPQGDFPSAPAPQTPGPHEKAFIAFGQFLETKLQNEKGLALSAEQKITGDADHLEADMLKVRDRINDFLP